MIVSQDNYNAKLKDLEEENMSTKIDMYMRRACLWVNSFCMSRSRDRPVVSDVIVRSCDIAVHSKEEKKS